MTQIIMDYQIYAIGTLIVAICVCIIYFAKNLIQRGGKIKKLHNAKIYLIESFNNGEGIYEIIEKKQVIDVIIDNIKSTIDILNQEIILSQEPRETDKIDKIEYIEKEMAMFYEKMNNIEKRQEIERNEMPQGIFQSQTSPQEISLHTQQIRIMNQNIEKFLLVYKEKDASIEKKSKTITALQEKAEEKNRLMDTILYKLKAIEQKIVYIITSNQDNKKRILNEKTNKIDVQIISEIKKNQIFTILFILFVLLCI
ncbi:MAG: hypothetical protein WCL18_04165 [bacterium]